MNKLRSALAMLVLTAIVPAQSESAPSAANAEYEKLVAAWKAETQANQAATKKIQASEEFQAAQKAKDNAGAHEKNLVKPTDEVLK